MKVKRTERRIAAIGAHPYFAENKVKWTKLRAGEVIDIPKDEFDSIKLVFGLSIEAVEVEMKTETTPTLDDVMSGNGK